MDRCLKKSVKNKVSQEAWTNMTHSVSHLGIFGCVPYAHALDELRKKLDNKGDLVYVMLTIKSRGGKFIIFKLSDHFVKVCFC